MRSYKFILILATLLSIQIALIGSKAIELNDKNFEHDTQASTGGTTGDWLVKFCDGKNRECRLIEPLWDDLADRLRGRISVASVNIDKSPEVQTRFGIRSVPTIHFLRRGKFYEYKGEYDLEQLHEFAVDTYDKAANQGAIPVEVTAFQKLWQIMLIEIEENGGWLNTFLMKDDKGNINYPVVIIVYAIPLFTVIGVCIICMKGDDTDQYDQKKVDNKPQQAKPVNQPQKKDSNNKKKNK